MEENGVETEYTQQAEGAENGILRCDRCSYSTQNKYYLKQHVALVHNSERKFKCPFCSYAGKRSHNLKEHLSVHSDERPYHCEHCNASFRKKGHLTNHYKMHPSLDTYKNCCFCDGFSQHGSASALYIHLRNAHTDLIGTKIFTCKLCSFATDNDKYLAIHEMTHRNPEIFFEPERYSDSMFVKPTKFPESTIILKCSECGFETPSRRTLEAHVYRKHLPIVSPTTENTEHSTSAYELHAKQTTSSANNSPLPWYKAAVNKSEPIFPATVPSVEKQPGSKWRHPVFVPSWGQNKKAIYPSSNQEKHERTIQPNSQIKASINVTSNNKAAPVPVKFGCQLCDYVTLTERAIKAHMWKHVGNQKLEYPSFQNGPLSIYDGTPLAASNFQEPSDVSRPLCISVQSAGIAEKRGIDCVDVVKETELDCKKFKASGSGSSQKLKHSCSPFPKLTDHYLSSSISSPPPKTQTTEIPSTKTPGHPESDIPLVVADIDDVIIEMNPSHERSASSSEALPLTKTDGKEVDGSGTELVGKPEAEGEGTEKSASELQSIAALLIMLGEDVEPNWKTQATDNSMSQGNTTPIGNEDNLLPTTSNTETSELNNDKPKSGGICSSLLAVIEQLYESDVESMSKFVDRTDNGYRCKQCHYHTNDHKNMIKHFNTIHKKRDGLTCFLCDHKAVTRSLLYAHLQGHTKPQYKCEHCSIVFYHKIKLRVHMLRAHPQTAVGPVGFICSACNTKNPLPDGWNVESSPPSFKCTGCKRSIMINEFLNSKTTKVIVQDRMERKSRDSDQKCTICDFVAINTRSLKSHLKRHENDIRYSSQPLTMYKCTICGYVCHHAPSLKSHMWKHAGDNGFSYDFMSILNENSKSDIKQSFIIMKCCQCGFETASNKDLAEHMNTHRDEVRPTGIVQKSD